MTERLVIDRTDRFTRRRWAFVITLPLLGCAHGVFSLSRGTGPDGLYLSGFLIVLGLVLLGRMIHVKARKRVLVLDEQSIELRAADGWVVRRADVESLVLHRIRRAEEHRFETAYVYELKLKLRSAAKLRKQNGLTSTTRGPVQTTPDRFTEAEAWRIQEFARERLRLQVTTRQVPPTVRGQVPTAIPAPLPDRPRGRTSVIFPDAIPSPTGRIYATRQNSAVKRVFTTVMGWLSLAALVAIWVVRGLVESVPLFFAVFGVFVGGFLIAAYVNSVDVRRRAHQKRASELIVDANGLIWKFYEPTEYRRAQIPVRFELRWAEVRTVQVTNHLVDGTHTVHTVEIVPGDAGFAKRHPEMQRLWEAALLVGEAVPNATGAYRLQTAFEAEAVRRLVEAVKAHQPGVLHASDLAESSRP